MAVTSPGGEVRFRVRETDDRVGCSWKVQTHKATGDVYVFCREGARWMKASFHDSGQWHYNVMPDGLEQLAEGDAAYVGVTKNRDPIAPGWLHALRITVPRSEFRDGWRENKPPKQLIEIPVRPDRDAVSIDVYLVAPEASTVQFEGVHQLVGEMQRGDGGLVFIAAYALDLDYTVDQAFGAEKAEMRAAVVATTNATLPVYRVVRFGYDGPDGYLRQLEMAIDIG